MLPYAVRTRRVAAAGYNLKPGPVSERNYGLYYPNVSPVYDIGLQGKVSNVSTSDLPRIDYSASQKNARLYMITFLLASVALLL
ncbi:hypothetical protein AgCh_023960 [Apium graveolens]